MNTEFNPEQYQTAFERYEANPLFCDFCGNKIPYEKRLNTFCGSSCSAKFHNPSAKRKPQTYCLRCGSPKKRQNQYCTDCIKKRVYSKILELEKATCDRSRKEILLSQRGRRCESCGFEEWMGQLIPLELDHVDGDPDNNEADNLRLICPNCHALTDTYKARNSGNSKRQVMRRNRYKNGQTY